MSQIPLPALFGVIAWTLAEYVLHRYLGHDRRTWPNPFAAEHTRHHSQGNYFAPAWKKALVATGALAIITFAATLLSTAASALSFAIGFVAMYLAYEVVHRRDHTDPGIGSYGRFLRRHHFHHHFGNPKSNHGVTSPVWDWLFGTLEAPSRIRVPEELKMVWLVNPTTGEVWPELSSVYELKR